MKNYEVPFKDAKKDKDGYATLLVDFSGYYVPVKGRPLPLSKDVIKEAGLDEVKRLNLTRWELKDIPEIAKLTGTLCGKSLDAMLYWNGYVTAWKFDEAEYPPYVNEDRIDVHAALFPKIDKLETVFYKPHEDHTGNYGDESVHCVYFGNSDVDIDIDDLDTEDTTEDMTDTTHFAYKSGPKPTKPLAVRCREMVDMDLDCIIRAKRQHKYVPYAELADTIKWFSNAMDRAAFGKAMAAVLFNA